MGKVRILRFYGTSCFLHAKIYIFLANEKKNILEVNQITTYSSFGQFFNQQNMILSSEKIFRKTVDLMREPNVVVYFT